MADKSGVDSSIPVKRFLEGKDHKHSVDETSNSWEAPVSPGPELRDDVIKDRNAMITGESSHVEIEAGKVDEN